LLRRAIARPVADRLLASARQGQQGKRPCPLCTQPMVVVATAQIPRTVQLDVCTGCRLVWFDPKEYSEMPLPSPGQPIPVEVTDLLGRWEARVRAGTPVESEQSKRWVDRRWKWIPAVLGMPVERDSALLLFQPWLTWAVAAAIVAASGVAFFHLEALVYQFGLIPAQFWRFGGLTFLTSFFLHAGLFHLASNVYFLLTYGDNVEDYLGRTRFLLLLLLSALVGDGLHVAVDPESTLPVIGASGGISGVITFYALLFPQARLLIMTRWLLYWPLRMRARTALLLWILLQLVGVWQQLAGFSRVSSLAHLGGAGVGLAFWFQARRE
jgi:membrane associated rhomboid family serine protease